MLGQSQMDENLFIGRSAPDQTLAQMAAKIFAILRIEDWEERQSSNYPPDDHYFAAYTTSHEINIYDADDGCMPSYPFRMSVKRATWRKGVLKMAMNPEDIAATLATQGMSVFLPEGDWWHSDWSEEGKVFRPKN